MMSNWNFSFADSTTQPLYRFTSGLKSVQQVQSSGQSFVKLSSSSSSPTAIGYYTTQSADVTAYSSNDVYVFSYPLTANYTLCFVSDSQGSFHFCYSGRDYTINLSQHDTSLDLYYYYFGGFSSYVSPISNFSSLALGLSSFYDYISARNLGILQLNSTPQDLGGYTYNGVGLLSWLNNSVYPVYVTGYFANEDTQCRVVYASPYNPSSYSGTIQYSQGGSGSTFQLSQFTLDSSTGLYYFSPSSYFGNTSQPLIGSYQGLSSALSAIKTYIDNPPSPSQNTSSYSVENGYLTVIDIGNGNSYDLTLTSLSERLSNFLTGKFTYANQSYWFGSSLPSEGYEFPPSNAVLIDWSEGTPKNVLGQSYSMVAELSGTASSRYLFIYNPIGYQDPDINAAFTSSLEYNSSMTVAGLLPNTHYYIYNSSGVLTLDVGGVLGTISGTEYGVGVSSSSGGISYPVSSDNSSSVYVQTSGGDTSGSVASIQGYLNSLVNILDGFVDNFLLLLTAPVSHIQQLIMAGGNFMSTLVHLFDWLPSEVSSVFVSALIVLVVIGIFKVFL